MSIEIVRRIKEQLEAKGQRWQTNEDAFAITARVAWALWHHGAQLIVKRPEQNGAVYRGVKYSHDSIAFPGQWIDCLAGAGPPDNRNEPAWNPTGTSMDAQLIGPFDPDAGFVSDPPQQPPLEPPAVPMPPDSDDLAAVAAALRDTATQLNLLRGELLTMKEAQSGLVAGLTQLAIALAHLQATQALGLHNRFLGALSVPEPEKKS